MIRPIVESLQIPIFNRVRSLHYEVYDVDKIPIRPDEIAKLHALEQISVVRKGATPINDSEVQSAKRIVPVCRLASVEQTSHQIDLHLDTGSQLACDAPQ